MYHGDVKNRINKHHLVANEKGFVSLYALLILQVVLAFVLLLIASSKAAFANQKMKDDFHVSQMYALYHVKSHLNRVETNPPVEEGVEDDETVEDEVIEESEPIAENSEEVISYLNQEIKIIYQPTQVHITIEHVQFYLEIEDKNIMNLVYL